jgi:hypothetical protein
LKYHNIKCLFCNFFPIFGIWNDQNVGIFGMELEFHGIPGMHPAIWSNKVMPLGTNSISWHRLIVFFVFSFRLIFGVE